MCVAATIIGCGSPDGNMSEPVRGSAGVQSAAADEQARSDGRDDGAANQPPAAEEARTVLFIGTSLTAGLGVAPEESFPLLLNSRIESSDLPFRVVNAGVSGETSAGALARIDWLLRQPFDVVVLETGANDMLRGVDPAATERNIQQIVDRIRTARPGVPIVLAGMLALPNLGQEYARAFESVYPRLAERNGLPLVPFLLEGGGGERELNQSDGVHPNADGHRVVADNVWRVLEPVLIEIGRG